MPRITRGQDKAVKPWRPAIGAHQTESSGRETRLQVGEHRFVR